MSILTGLFSLDLFALKGDPLTYDYNHRLSGTIKTNTVATPDVRVSAFVRASNKFLDVVYTDSQGKFNFTGLPTFTDGFLLTIVAIDETGTYNALIADKLLSVGINEER